MFLTPVLKLKTLATLRCTRQNRRGKPSRLKKRESRGKLFRLPDKLR
jgi:hypothetical protein